MHEMKSLLSSTYSYWSGYFFPGVIASIFCLLLFILNAPRKNKSPFRGWPILGHLGFLPSFLKSGSSIKPIVYILQGISGLQYLLSDEVEIFDFHMLYKRYVFLLKPESVEVLLSSSVLIEKSQDYNFFHSWLGTGLLTSKGEKWRTRRKLLTPTFHYQILEDFLPIINEQAEILVEKLHDATNLEVIDVVPVVANCTLDIICETAMGVSIGAQRDSDHPYVRSVSVVSDLATSRIFMPWLWNEVIFRLSSTGRRYYRSLRVLHGFTRKVISERKAEMLLRIKNNESMNTEKSEFGERRRQAFLDRLLHYHLANPEELSEEGIREEVDTFAFEGHDTTATGISWALYMIGLYPEVQEKVHQELDIIFGSENSGMIRTTCTSEDLKDMKYLECVIKESQRLYPSVPIIARELQQSVDICGNHIEKGVFCCVMTFQLHRNPHVFPDPERFDPDRFTLEQSSGRHPYAYVPFSAGPRNCIGQRFAMMEEKTILAHILRRFHITSLDPRDKIHVLPEMVSRSAQGIRLRIQER